MLDPSTDSTLLHGTDLTVADICWDIAQRLEGRLSAMGSLVILSHAKHSAPLDERERATLANTHNADLVVSLTMDYFNEPLANGLATYYFGHALSHSAMGLRLAELVQQEVPNRTFLRDCHSHPKTWDLLRLTKMPAIRIELGYVANPADCQIVASADQRDAIANGVALSISRVLAAKIG